MRKLLFAAFMVGACVSLRVAGQDQLQDYTRTLKGDVPLNLVQVNAKTLPSLFQPPTLYQIRARIHDNTIFYVQGTPSKDVQLNTKNFTLQQGGESTDGTPQNIKNFETGKVAKGEHIDGVLVFAKVVDMSKPFTVMHGKDSVEFQFTSDQVKAMTSAEAAPKR